MFNTCVVSIQVDQSPCYYPSVSVLHNQPSPIVLPKLYQDSQSLASIHPEQGPTLGATRSVVVFLLFCIKGKSYSEECWLVFCMKNRLIKHVFTFLLTIFSFPGSQIFIQQAGHKLEMSNTLILYSESLLCSDIPNIQNLYYCCLTNQFI